jgi:hypothetical protein
MGAVECDVAYVPTSEYPSEAECEAEAGHPSEVRYPYGTELILTAKGSESEFLGWRGGGCEDEEEECYVTMEGALGGIRADPAARPRRRRTVRSSSGQGERRRRRKVKGGKAALKLSCSGGPCGGSPKLTAKLGQGGKTRTLTIGRASFKLAAGASKTLKVKLSAPAKRELAKGGTLRAKLSGTAIAASTVKLRPAAPRS